VKRTSFTLLLSSEHVHTRFTSKGLADDGLDELTFKMGLNKSIWCPFKCGSSSL